MKHYYQDYTALIMACYSKQKEVVQLLLSRNCTLNVFYYTNEKDKDGNKQSLDALHAACRSKSNKDIIDMLMDETEKWNYDNLTQEFDCDKDMIAYVKSKRPKEADKK